MLAQSYVLQASTLGPLDLDLLAGHLHLRALGTKLPVAYCSSRTSPLLSTWPLPQNERYLGHCFEHFGDPGMSWDDYNHHVLAKHGQFPWHSTRMLKVTTHIWAYSYPTLRVVFVRLGPASGL